MAINFSSDLIGWRIFCLLLQNSYRKASQQEGLFLQRQFREWQDQRKHGAIHCACAARLAPALSKAGIAHISLARPTPTACRRCVPRRLPNCPRGRRPCPATSPRRMPLTTERQRRRERRDCRPSRQEQPAIATLPTTTTPPAASTIATCSFKACKKVGKLNALDETIAVCWNSLCVRRVHIGCTKRILASFRADQTFDYPVCGKRCFNACLKAMRGASDGDGDVKKRVMWHNDGATPSISSLVV
jgi:hypothetical protein